MIRQHEGRNIENVIYNCMLIYVLQVHCFCFVLQSFPKAKRLCLDFIIIKG
jgi:hypothetical protein